ncbi:hypothetical protein BUE80_DR010982 [Diplocarpon rosae]|nr:hypothetical protein BUE80_DR010982 [Diplocarpon rosae]
MSPLEYQIAQRLSLPTMHRVGGVNLSGTTFYPSTHSITQACRGMGMALLREPPSSRGRSTHDTEPDGHEAVNPRARHE